MFIRQHLRSVSIVLNNGGHLGISHFEIRLIFFFLYKYDACFYIVFLNIYFELNDRIGCSSRSNIFEGILMNT